MEIREKLVETTGDEDLLFMDGFDDCIIGAVQRFGMGCVVCYDYDKVIRRLMKLGGRKTTYEDAVEYFEFNQIGAWLGEKTPCFLKVVKHDKPRKKPSACSSGKK